MVSGSVFVAVRALFFALCVPALPPGHRGELPPCATVCRARRYPSLACRRLPWTITVRSSRGVPHLHVLACGRPGGGGLCSGSGGRWPLREHLRLLACAPLPRLPPGLRPPGARPSPWTLPTAPSVTWVAAFVARIRGQGPVGGCLPRLRGPWSAGGSILGRAPAQSAACPLANLCLPSGVRGSAHLARGQPSGGSSPTPPAASTIACGSRRHLRLRFSGGWGCGGGGFLGQ